jgi:Domain of unknown function (DUF3806)
VGFLDRMRGRSESSAPEASPPDGTDAPEAADPGLEGIEPVDEIGTRRLTGEEEVALDTARSSYGEHGIDPTDIATIDAAYERALSRAEDHDPGDAVEVLSIALGDFLVSQADYRWVISSDPFGTDLAVAPPRRGAPVVTRTLVAVRWMSRETGWLSGVAQHLARAGGG